MRIFQYVLVVMFVLCLIFQDYSYSEEQKISLPVLSEDLPNADIDLSNKSEKLKNINLDMNTLYGIQYNQVFSSLSLSQEKDTFVYLLSYNFSRSADFGYNNDVYSNSGFYENTIGLTANWNLSNTKFIIEGATDNKSRGMFDNEIYSREEKGNNKVSAKTIYKLNPSTEVSILLGSAWYKHNLIAINSLDYEKSRVLQGNAELGIEYVWSASNRMRLGVDVLYYDYNPEEVDSDRHMRAELIDDFNFTRNVGISIGGGYVNNKDDKEVKGTDVPVIYNTTLSFKGYKYLNTSLLYKFDITPFQPEEFYLQQKYINPNYDLPPGEVHTGEIRADSKINSIFNLRANLKVEKNKYYYNYFSTYGNVLSATTIDVMLYNGSIEANFLLSKGIWVLAFGYNYVYFDADKNVTYRPEQEATASIRYNGKNWKFDWTNSMRGKVYTDPDDNDTLPEAFIGSFGIQRQMLAGSYLYSKIDNLYNNKYSLRKGYPEPGVAFLFGLRLLI